MIALAVLVAQHRRGRVRHFHAFTPGHHHLRFQRRLGDRACIGGERNLLEQQRQQSQPGKAETK
ncbi:hypothetical protein D3C71_1804350 [compost metagenome]